MSTEAHPWNGEPGSEAEERIRGTQSYLDVLRMLHERLRPEHYLEIGVRHGVSLSLARGAATGVDPAPDIKFDLLPTTNIMHVTSDVFFAQRTKLDLFDLCFIDGMHHFEFALRDFRHFERCAKPGAIAVIDDVLPNHPAQAARNRRTFAWTGDVWKIVEILRKYRRDLKLTILDTSPTGLLIVAGLDPTNNVLFDRYEDIVQEAAAISEPPNSVFERVGAIDPFGSTWWSAIEASRVDEKRCAKPAFEHARSAAPKLSVVVVGYNMARELPRTIRSLSPRMQREIDPDDYEVIVIENGSTQPADAADLRDTMSNISVMHLPNAGVSPVAAINTGIAMARGSLVGVFIDGARMASPGLLSAALAASRVHPRPMIGTIAFHLGPIVQSENIKLGYDQSVEDSLLAACRWEEDPYRLFSISCLASSSADGWLSVPAESNALFLTAEHWRSIGGWDDRFESPGGGLVNLDMWLRVCEDREGELIMLLGEATFHQVHGGIATNNLNAPHVLFHEEYMRIRGKAYARPDRAPLFFGKLHPHVLKSFATSLNRML